MPGILRLYVATACRAAFNAESILTNFQKNIYELMSQNYFTLLLKNTKKIHTGMK